MEVQTEQIRYDTKYVGGASADDDSVTYIEDVLSFCLAMEEGRTSFKVDTNTRRESTTSSRLNVNRASVKPPLEIACHNILKCYQLVLDDEIDKTLNMSFENIVCPEVLSDLAYFSSQFDRPKKRFSFNGAEDKSSTLKQLKRRPSMRLSFMDSSVSRSKVRTPVVIKTCDEYLGRMGEIRQVCNKHGLIPVYYYTMPSTAEEIAEKGIRFGSTNTEDVGIYFTTLSPASFDVGCPEYETNLILDMVGCEHIDDIRDKLDVRGGHKFDVCFVYAAESRVLRQAPGWRNASIMVPKSFMETFLEPRFETGDFLLRPDTGLWHASC